MSNEFVNASVAAGYGSEARALIAALERIAEWACYASEEDTSAKPLALQQIGVTAREALAAVGENTK